MTAPEISDWRATGCALFAEPRKAAAGGGKAEAGERRRRGGFRSGGRYRGGGPAGEPGVRNR